MGFSSPHTGTENWLNWLSDPTYTTYITPNAIEDDYVREEETVEPTTEIPSGSEPGILEEALSVSGTDALEHVRSGREGTLPVPNVPNYPVGRSQLTRQDEESITNTLNETKLLSKAYSKYKSPEPLPTVQKNNESQCDKEPLPCFDKMADGERQTQRLREISLHVCACTARMVTYNVMARCAAAIPSQAEDYSTAITLGRKEIHEILRFATYFYSLMDEGTSHEESNRFGSPESGEDSYSPDSYDSSTDGDFSWSKSRQPRQIPHLARSYIGFMILWPLATAATTELVDADQFEYIIRLQEYITQTCGIRMAKGIQQFCVEKRQMSGVAFQV
jgi:hypothetical protein